MEGFGAYGNGGPYPYSSSSPSSLSALAPPFTVDRSASKPLSSPIMDVTVPPYVSPLNSSLHNWLAPHPPTTGSNFFANPTTDFNSMPSSNAYGYAGRQTADPSNTNVAPVNPIATPSSNAFTYGQSLDGVATSFVEAEPYYPCYLSTAVHCDSPLVVSDPRSYDWLSTTHFAPLDGSSHKVYTQRASDSKYTAQWDGLFGGLAEWEQGKNGDFDGSFCSKKTDVSGSLLYKNFMNQEPHSSSSLKSCEEASHGINIMDWEKHSGSLSAEHLVGKNSKFIPSDFTGSLPAVPETHLTAPSSQFVTKTTNCRTPYSVSSEKRQHDANVGDFTSISMSSPAFTARTPAIGTKCSETGKGLNKRSNFRSDATDPGHGDYYPSSVQETHLPRVSEGKVHFDSTQLGIHLGTNNRFSVEASSTRNEELSNNRSISQDTWNHVFKSQAGIHNSHVSTDGFNAALNTNETINSFLGSSDNVDSNNPAVDSPCWKGVPVSRFSPFEASEDPVSEQMKKLEDCNGLKIEMPLMFSLNASENASSQKPIGNTVEYNDFGWLKSGLTFPLKRFSVADSALGENKLDDSMKTSYYSERSHNSGTQSYRDVLHKSGNEDKFLGLFDHSHPMQQGHGEDGLALKVQQTTSCGSDVKLNANGTMEYGSSPVTSYAQENILCSSVEDATTKLSKSNEEESMMKVDVQMLVDTMTSLSESLLINCSNGSCQVKNDDIEALKAVINNLYTCLSKNVTKSSPLQESPSFEPNTSGELSEHYKVLSASASNVRDQVMHSVSVKNDIDMVKEDKMTQAIKEILSENFHGEETDPQAFLYKNLWLEAEAALCSINYKARFNRVKIEMDKCKGDKSKDVFECSASMMKQSRPEVSPDSNPVNPLTPEGQGCPTSNLQDSPILSQEDNVLARFHILRSRVENTDSINAAHVDESCSMVSAEPDKFEKIAPGTNGSPSPGISIRDSSTSTTTGLTNDYEASVMARFRILRDRVEKDQVEKSKFPCAVHMEEPSSSKVSLEPKADESVPDTSDGSVPFFKIKDSPVPITTSGINDCEDSVMSRLHILKSRDDNFNDMLPEGEQLPEPKIDLFAPHPNDVLIPEFSIHDFPVSSATKQANDMEASMVSRLHILRSRVDNSYMDTEVGGLGYTAGKRNPWPVISKRSSGGGSSDLKEQRISETQKADNLVNSVATAKEFHLFGEDDDPLTQYHKINRPAANQQLPAGWHDTSSSSDWEHVMKEEILGHNS